MHTIHAIETKYIPSTDYRPGRIKAWFRNDEGRARSVTVPYAGMCLSMEEDHAVAVRALIERYIDPEYRQQWLSDEWAIGDTATGYVFCRQRFGLLD